MTHRTQNRPQNGFFTALSIIMTVLLCDSYDKLGLDIESLKFFF